MARHLLTALVLVLALAGLGGCTWGLAGDTAQEDLAIGAADYRLGPGDEVRVVVFGQPTLSGDFVVDGSGSVAMPLVGGVPATGRTVREFERAVEDRLRGDYVLEPRVSAQVTTFRPYFILGEVNKPGKYPFVDGLTVVNAIATAEGFTYRAETGRVLIKRSGDTAEHAVRLSPTTPVMPGDTIRVPERFF